MGAMASQITSLTIVYVYSIVHSVADQIVIFIVIVIVIIIVTDRWIPRKRPSNAENVSIWWRHHDICAFVVAYNPMHHTGNDGSVPDIGKINLVWND